MWKPADHILKKEKERNLESPPHNLNAWACFSKAGRETKNITLHLWLMLAVPWLCTEALPHGSALWLCTTVLYFGSTETGLRPWSLGEAFFGQDVERGCLVLAFAL